jgi:hypothetical protein
MSTRKRKRLPELPKLSELSELSAESAAKLDSFVIGGHNVLDEELLTVPQSPLAPPTSSATEDDMLQEKKNKETNELDNKQLKEQPLRNVSNDEWDARRAHLALKQSEEGNDEMLRIGEANLEDMQDLEQKMKKMKKMKRKHGVGGTKKNKKNKKNKKKNKTKKGGKRSRRGGKKTRRRKKYKN